MRSWIFRHRLRLKAVYGAREATPAHSGPTRAQATRRRVQGLAPGECGRRGEIFYLRPRTPGAA
ncbi:MAG: hypothetical protein RL277_1075 [Planctomycetota bacterium]|jgi:hypothetical protein